MPIKPVHAVRGDVVAAFVVFTGCMPSPSGTCDRTVDFTVLKPDGSVYSEAKNNPLLTGKSAEAPTVQLSSAHLDIRIEQQDPLGMYTVKAHVRDKRANITIDVEQRFEVVVAIPPGEQPGDLSSLTRGGSRPARNLLMTAERRWTPAAQPQPGRPHED